MKRIICMCILLSLFRLPFASAQEIYYQNDSTVIRRSLPGGSTDTVWSAPFDIFDVSISRDGNFICFTRWEKTKSGNAREQDPRREVGFYSVTERKFSIIKSEAHYNFGAVISQNNNLIGFNYLIQPGDWKAAVYDRKKDSVIYAVDTLTFFGWRSDSLLLFATFKGVVQENLYDRSRKVFPLPDTTMMDIAIPGTELFYVSDSLYFFLCMDMVVSPPDFDGPAENIFITRDGKTSRILNGAVNVDVCKFAERSLYIDFTDFARSRKGKHRLVRYDAGSGKLVDLKPSGILVGVKGN